MHISDKGLSLIKTYEGCRLDAYRCPAGVLTIGYGHTAGVVEGQRISQAQAEQYLREDMIKYERYVEKYVSLPLNQNQFDALVSFTYNCGLGNLQKLVKNRNHEAIANALPLYNKANGKVLRGLVKRRASERQLFLTPCGNNEKCDTETYPATSYTGNSIVEGLRSIGVGFSFSFRREIAQANGIKGYTGTLEQNLKMLELLKAGKLIKV